MPQLLTIVIPCFNDEAVIAETFSRLKAVCSTFDDLRAEFIFVDDGSGDSTSKLLRDFTEHDKRVHAIILARNFGHQVAITAGIASARGDAVVVIDSDLQDPPEIINEMVSKWREGYQVVYGTRTERQGEPFIRLASMWMFYRILSKLSDIPIPLDSGDFRLMSREVVEALLAMPERDRYVRGMVAWIGFKQIALPYRRAPRFAGKSHYSLSKLVRLAVDGVLSFSTKPLQASIVLGAATAGIAFLGILYALILRLFTTIWIEGWTALMIAILFIGGVQLISVGILGEYIGRIYKEVKQRPLYIVAEHLGVDRGRPDLLRGKAEDDK